MASKIIYSVQGNIGSGKSTLLSMIHKNLSHTKVIPQPVVQWQNISTKYNLLQMYYRDPNRWAFTFQANALITRMKQLNTLLDQISPNSDQYKYFTERSIIADKEIFAKLLHNQNKMSDMQYEIYLKMFQSLDELFKTPKAHKYIYLRTSPKLCYERMKKRNRFEEQAIPLNYFEQIHKLHEDWLLEDQNALIVDGQKQFQTCNIRSNQIIKIVDNFF